MTSTPSPGQIHILDAYEDPVTDDEALIIYRWLDSVEFTRSKKTAANRDFSDAVMMAELVAHYVPKICNATFYVPTSATGKKIENWNHLNQKVLHRIGFQFTPELIQKLATSRRGVIERVLREMRPTLLRGHQAVIPNTHKLDLVKPRLMDYEKTQPKANSKRPSSAPQKTKSSAVKTKPKAPRPRTADAKRGSRDNNGNEDNVDGTAVTELEEDQPIDIICSPLETVDQRPGSPRQIPYDDDSMDQVEAELIRRGRPFKKRVIKYEYKEEFVVNGTGNFHLIRQQQGINAAKNGGPLLIKEGYDLV